MDMNKSVILGVELGSGGLEEASGVEYNADVFKNFWRASGLFRRVRQVQISVWNSGEILRIDQTHSAFAF